MSKFFILSLPRSRSKWLSEFLSWQGRSCGHDELLECNSIADFQSRMRYLGGSCETAGVLGWRLLRRLYPDAKFIAIYRDPKEVIESITRQTGLDLTEQILSRHQMLLEFMESDGVVNYDFHALGRESCKEIFEECIWRSFDESWYNKLAGRNIQIDLRSRLARLTERSTAIEQFKSEVGERECEIGC